MCAFHDPAASVPVVGFNAVLMSEHFGAFLAFAILHVAILVRYVHSMLSPKHFRVVVATTLSLAVVALGLAVAGIITYVLKSPTLGWTGERATCTSARTHACSHKAGKGVTPLPRIVQ